MFTPSIRYKAHDGAESGLLEYPIGAKIATESLREDSTFTATVTQFGMLLRDSQYKGSASYESIAEQLSSMCLKGIADFLFAQSIPSARGKPQWAQTVINGLLSNQCYFDSIISFFKLN